MNKSWLLLILFFAFPVQADVSEQIEIHKPFARSALQQQRNSAVFMTLNNTSSDAAIVNATSSAADIVELHTHINDEGVMRMRRIPKIDLPANQKTELKPGGLHVMLIGLRHDLKVGDSIDVTLKFSDSSQTTLTVPVHKVMPMHSMKNHHKMMQH